jgi:hypothetical protein
MKKLVLSIFIVAVSVVASFAQAPAAILQLTVTNTSTTAPIQLVTTNLLFTSVTIRGLRSAQLTNTSAVNIGFGVSADTKQALTIDPGSFLTISSGPVRGGSLYNMSNIWLDVSTANDGVVIFYER